LQITALLLCGGRGSRFGGDKLLAGHEPVAARAARHLVEGAGHVLAVTPVGAVQLRALLERAGCKVIESDRTPAGMGATLAAGVAATPRADGWIVALGDMPAIAPRTITQVREGLEAGALIVAPFDAHGRRGHPVGFSARLRDELLGLEGDAGARDIVARHSGAIMRIGSDDQGIFIDIDTRADLDRLLSGE
jgi:molybdenum cofactor cytidylyltransferase